MIARSRENESQVGSRYVFRQPAIERCKDCLADGCAMLQNIVAPEAENGESLEAHELIAFAVIRVVGMLRTVDFNDKLLSAAAEISEVGADGKLAGELVATEITTLEFKPKQSFRLIVSLP